VTTSIRAVVRAATSAPGTRRSGEGGQMVLLIAPLAFLFVVFGVAVVDFGQWFAERRTIQAEADLIALAGALELPSFDDDAGAVVRARAAALAWAAHNGVDPTEVTIEVVDSCFAGGGGADEVHTGVRATVQRSPGSHFLGILPGATDPVIRASAVACSGTPAATSGFLPWAVERSGGCFSNEPNLEDRSPELGARCSISVGGSGGAQGDVGQLGFEPNGLCEEGNSGANVYEANIETGVPTSCRIGDSVSSNSGVNVGKTQSGLQARLATEGACSVTALPFFATVQSDTVNFNGHPTLDDLLLPTSGNSGGGVDDFFEVFRPSLGYDVSQPAANLSALDCDSNTAAAETSVRNVVVIVIDDIGVSDGTGCTGGGATSNCYLVRGFARIYIEGCSTNAGFDATCSQGGAGGSFTVHARMVNAFADSGGELTLNRIGGFQTYLRE
jgi:hypothetical protein